MNQTNPVRNIKLTIEYDGTAFNGWQIQAKGFRTVQGEIKSTLERICKEKIILIGSGRTDTGVHAQGQVANFKTTSRISVENLKKALNFNLPEDIAISKVEEVPLNFHAQFSAKTKTYRYTILNRDYHSPHGRHLAYFYPYKLNLKSMKEEAKNLIGRKDFKSFQTNNGDDKRGRAKSAVRHMKRIDVKKNGNLITFDIEADGFLYKMVRTIVGTLLKIGNGSMPKGSLKKILTKKDRKFAGIPAKACGLTLLEVKY